MLRNCCTNYFPSYVSDSSLNVISVEWSNLAAGPDYLPAARNTQLVSKNDTKTSWALRMHIMGHWSSQLLTRDQV